MNIKAKLILFTLVLLFTVPFSLAQEDEPAKVRGRVTSYFGNPLEDIEVKFFLLEKVSGKYVSAEGRFIKSVRTNKEGTYSVSGLPWGEYRVIAETEDVWRFYLWRNADRVLDLGLYIPMTHGLPELEAIGKVKQLDKSSVADATVTLINAFDETKILRARTDKNGNFKIQFIQPGQYVLYVSKPGYSVSATSFLINAAKVFNAPYTGSSKKIDVVLSPLQ